MMRVSAFLHDLQELLQCDVPLTADTVLAGLEAWDSLAVMSCMAYFDKKLGVKTRFGQYKGLNSIADLIALAEGAVR
jgi:acyl carrier protein